jgi:hypothetical protein
MFQLFVETTSDQVLENPVVWVALRSSGLAGAGALMNQQNRVFSATRLRREFRMQQIRTAKSRRHVSRVDF